MGYDLGVDLGTTFVAAAVSRNRRVEMCGLGNQRVVTPAVVYLSESSTLLFGEAAERQAISHPDRVEREFKRRLGDPTPVVLAGVPYQVTGLMAAQLRDVLTKVTAVEGGPPDRVALTHPANWGPYRRELFEEIPHLAGLSTHHTLTEPEAAAAHYAASRHLGDGDTIAVYDLGGGTFDAAVLQKRSGGIELLGEPEGIERLGGIDFDEAILQWINYKSGGALTELDRSDPQAAIALAKLRQECALAKEALSADTETTIPVLLPQRHFYAQLTRSEFEGMIRSQIESTVGTLVRAVRAARVDVDRLSAVLLVGGSSRIPLIARMISDELGRPTVVDAHPKHAVALGAATVASTRSLPYAHASQGSSGAPSGAPSSGAPSSAAPPSAATGSGAGGQGTAVRDDLASVGSGSAGPASAGAGSVGSGSAGSGSGGSGPGGSGPGSPGPGSAGSAGSAGSTTSGYPGATPGSAGFPNSNGHQPGGQGSGMSGYPPAGAGTPAGMAGLGGPGGLPAPRTPNDGRARRRILLGVTAAVVVLLAGFGLKVVLDRGSTSAAGSSAGSAAGSSTGSSAGSSTGPSPSRQVSPSASASSPAPSPSPSPSAALAVPVPALGPTISLGSNPNFVVASPNGRQLYIANPAQLAVTVFDTAANQVTATIQVPAGPPQFLAFSPDGRFVYVSIWDKTGGKIAAVSVLDTADNSIKATIQVKTRPFLAAVTPDGKLLYVPNHDSGTVSVIDTTQRKVVAEITVAPNPHYVVFSRDGSRAYTANHESNVISVIDTATRKVLTTVAVGKSPHSIAVNPKRPLLMNVNYDGKSVSVIDATTNKVIKTIEVGTNPQNVNWSPDGRFAYVVNNADSTVSVISADSLTVTATLPTGGKAPTSIAVLPDGTKGFVNNLDGGSLRMINLAAT